LTTGKTAQVREAINKFRLNRRITEIQRNFLKRLLMSKLVSLSLPSEMFKLYLKEKTTAAFLKLLNSRKDFPTFVERTLKRSFGAFKNEYEEGQAAKKRAVIQLIDTPWVDKRSSTTDGFNH
jgi:chloramphenicol O-acetyltransferase